MNVSEIATRVKRQFGDEAGVQITDADVIRWTNDAMREIASNNGLLQTIATAAIVANQRQYTLPPDILTLRSVHYAGKKLAGLSNREAEEYIAKTQTEGTPTHFWIWANTINLYPQPTTADADDLQIFYTRQPALVAVVADVPEISIQYHNRIVEYCLAQAYELDENWAAAQLKAQQFTEGVKMLSHESEWTEQDFYPHITTSLDDL